MLIKEALQASGERDDTSGLDDHGRVLQARYQPLIKT
jgi:hypothetical protein